MENSIAIDIVFLLPKEVENEAKRINKILNGSEINSKIDFTNNRALPHISLAMGGVLPKNLDKLKNQLIEFSQTQNSPKIILNSLITKIGEKESITSFQFKENSRLKSFHTDLVKLVNPLMREKVNNSSFISDKISEDSINWVNNYFDKHSFDSFWPHITLGIGSYTESIQNYSFHASRLAICKLDDYCTCKEIVWETIMD